MKRKVVQQGPATLMVSLPSKWVKKYHITKGIELDVEEHNDALYIGNLKKKNTKLKTTIDVTNLDRTSILILIQSLYRFGFDEIDIKTDNTSVKHFRGNKNINVSSIIYEVINRLIGSELISNSLNQFTIKYITQESEDDLEIIIRRIFLLLNEMASSFGKAIKENDKELLESMEFQHINIKKFINYSLRLLNKFGHPDVQRTSFYFSIITSLSKIEDLIKNATRTILMNKIKIDKPTFDLYMKLKISIDKYYEFFYKCSFDRMKELGENRDIVKNELFKSMKNITKENLYVFTGLAQILEILLDMTELRMSLENLTK